MSEKQELVVQLNEEAKEKDAKVIEQVEQDKKNIEKEKEKEMTAEKEKDGSEEKDEKEKVEKKESVIDRFLIWWRGKPKAEAHLKDDEEVDDKEKLESEKIAQAEKNGGIEMEEERKKEESAKIELNGEDKEAKPQSELDKGDESEVVSSEETKREKQSSPTERRLEKIAEEEKDAGKTAPLAQAEDEEFESLDARPAIDQPLAEPNTSETVEAGKDSFEFESPPANVVEDKSEKRKPSRVEAFVVLDKPTDRPEAQTNDQQSVNTPSENDELKKDSRRDELSTQPSEKKANQQSGKMEDVIEERYDDVRRENVKETWKRLEDTDKETGAKTYRVSYTIRTESIDKTKKDQKQAEEDEDERLFGKDVLLNSTNVAQTYEGPPPENIEDEIQEEHAREDHAANEDIDRFFEICKEDAPIAQDETEEIESAPQDEIVPQTPDDVFRKLHSWDDEPTDWWTITKKKKEYEEWMKPMKDGTIRRVIIPSVEIPFETCVIFITDWKHREEWDKTFSEIQVLKSDKHSKIIYCPVNKRDLTFETMDREETDPPCHLMSWKRQDVIKDSEKADTLTRKKQKPLELITHTCGIILRPSESGDHATKITILCQLEGAVDPALKNTFLAGHPKTWLRNLKKYYKKQQKQDNQKVVYL